MQSEEIISLSFTHPDLAKEWHPYLNDISVTDVKSTNSQKAWWLGACGHEWDAKISDRSKGAGWPPKIISDLTEDEVLNFLSRYSFNETSAGSSRLGIKVNGEMKSILISRREGEGLRILQHAHKELKDNYFEVLLSHAEKVYKPDFFLCGSDNSLSQDHLYLKNGFIVDKITEPDYRYVIGSKRIHKDAYTIERFRSDPDLMWKQGLTNSELAKLNGIPRIWDAGQTLWVKMCNNSLQHMI